LKIVSDENYGEIKILNELKKKNIESVISLVGVLNLFGIITTLCEDSIFFIIFLFFIFLNYL